MRTAVKCPIYPDDEQAAHLRAQFGAVRFAWNHALALRKRYHAIYGAWLPTSRLKKRLAVMKKRPKWAWMKGADSQSLQEALRNMQKALNSAFEGRARFPVFKKRSGKQSSFHCTNARYALAPSGALRGNAVLFVAKMKGGVRMNLHRPIPPDWVLKSVTISRSKSGKHYASLAFEDGKEAPVPEATVHKSEIEAADVGVNTLLTTSSGKAYPNPRHERRNEKRLKSKNRSLSRKVKGSRNWHKARVSLAREHEKQANRRADHLHKISRDLVDKNQVIGFEGNFVGDVIRAGGGLAKSLQGAGLGTLIRFTEYKAKRAGKRVIRVDRFFPSSKTCNPCGNRNADLGRGEVVWTCPCCGAVLDRDHNAAQNLRTETIRTLRAAGLVVLGT